MVTLASRIVGSAVALITVITALHGSLYAQPKPRPNLSGVWAPLGGRGADPQVAPPPAGPIVLKPEYAKPYQDARAADAAAAKRGEPIASASMS
jgi:hypothetical protein